MNKCRKLLPPDNQPHHRKQGEKQKRNPTEEKRDSATVAGTEFGARGWNVRKPREHKPGEHAQRRAKDIIDKIHCAAKAMRRVELKHFDGCGEQRSKSHRRQNFQSMGLETPQSEIGGHTKGNIDSDVDGHVEKNPPIVEVGVPGMKQDVKRAGRKLAGLKHPRIKRTVNDE